MAGVVRKLVSKKKRRFEWGGYDLDLSYITDRVIAMGFPSESLEGLFRNKMSDVVKFLDTLHPNHYKVYNLCSERKYDKAKFHGRVGEYPFDDHTPPTLELIMKFCLDVGGFLDEHPENVVVVHCKAGKGRTGTMIACFMLWSRVSRTASEAMRVYGQKRTLNGKGVTIPSQQRFVRYFGQCLARADESYADCALDEGEKLAHPAVVNSAAAIKRYSTIPYNMILPPATSVILSRIEMHSVPMADLSGGCEPWVSITQRGTTVYKSKPLKAARSESTVLKISCDNTMVSEEVRVMFFHKSSKNKLFAFTIHTAFVGQNLCLWKRDLDTACKDRTHKIFHQNFFIQLFFKDFSESGADDAVRCFACGNIITKGDLSVHCGNNAWHWNCTFCCKCNQHVGDKCTFDANDQPLCVNCASSRDADGKPQSEFFQFCDLCGGVIDEEHIEAGTGVWHPYCFKCSVCSEVLQRSDVYTATEKRIVCESCSKKAAAGIEPDPQPSPYERLSVNLELDALDKLQRLSMINTGRRSSEAMAPATTIPPKPTSTPPRPRGSTYTFTNKEPDKVEPVAQVTESAIVELKKPPPSPITPRRTQYELCIECLKPLVAGESKIMALGRKIHKDCFKCGRCHNLLADLRFHVVEKAPPPEKPDAPPEQEAWCANCFADERMPHCSTCSQPITDSSFTKVGNLQFHRACFCCARCNEPINAEFMRHEGKVYCIRDYNALFARCCAVCAGPLSSSAFLKLGQHEFHVNCLVCRVCARSLATEEFFLDPQDGWPCCHACAQGKILSAYPDECPMRVT